MRCAEITNTAIIMIRMKMALKIAISHARSRDRRRPHRFMEREIS